MHTVARHIETWFLPLALVASALALIHPPLFTWLRPHISVALGVIMFGMGLTLEFKDFAGLAARWRLVPAAALLQYVSMPLFAVLMVRIFGLDPQAAVGLIVVGACPGGTASNVITYLAKGNVALSVTMTLVSTALAPVLTPAAVWLLCGQRVTVDFWGMAASVFWIVVFPLVDGLVLRRLLGRRVHALVEVFPAVSIVTITVVVACVVGLNQASILALPLAIGAAVICHSLAGFALGWGAGRLLSRDRRDAVALSVEIGMQNSGLGVALAQTFFSIRAALPGALFSLVQNLIGVVLARVWTRRGAQAEADTSGPAAGDRSEG
ncbi:MAG: bile acid:sodium symporter family protein [Desulfovibrionaceae bacterium]